MLWNAFFLFFGGAIETISSAAVTLDAGTVGQSIQFRAAEKQKENQMVFSSYKLATPTGFQSQIQPPFALVHALGP